jgi:hypothetical protein
MRDDEMVRVWHSDEINITTWNFFDGAENPWLNLLAAGFAVYVNKTICEEFQKSPPSLSLPCMWAPEDGAYGKCPDDFATLYLTLPLGGTDGDNVCWSLSLEGVIDDLIVGHANPQTGKVEDPQGQNICAKVAKRLRELADKLDAAMDKTPSQGGS